MIKEAINNNTGKPVENHNKLSIQVSLNGLSFCILDTAKNAVRANETLIFPKQLTPYAVLDELKQLFETYKLIQTTYADVVVVHRNNLFGLVPKLHFRSDELPNYLKFNSKILANDHMAFDEIDTYDLINVYVPFVNINNYLFELFGEFTFKHHGTVIIKSLLDNHISPNEIDTNDDTVCYLYVCAGQIDLTVIDKKKLLLYNNFSFVTKEDFVYYLLFTLEQLHLDTKSVNVKLFGDIAEDDDIYELCYKYITNISIFNPKSIERPLVYSNDDSVEFTTINAL